jgi:16S rRNA (uracil1498-N3)-methyltransferase
MNLLLLAEDHCNDSIATVSGRQLEHLLSIQCAQVGDSVRVGKLNGLMGKGLIKTLNADLSTLEINLDTPSPAAIPLTLILALPRPKMLRRILQTIAAMGIKRLYLVNSRRVEKSFWQTPMLRPEAVQEQLILGLEQARDTIMPKIYLRKLFKPFVEDELAEIIAGSSALVAHPTTAMPCPINCQAAVTLAVGPEGGFIPYEVEKLNEIGFESVHLGPRILRVENAVPAIISRLFPG